MYSLYLEMLEVMDSVFQDYAAALPSPVKVRMGNGWVFRFEGRDIEHAVVLKLALVQSTLRAALTLLQSGYTTQQGMLQRVIDEANEDILFLVYAVTNDTITELHKRYLDAFWAEEFADPNNLNESHQSRDMVKRQKIRAYLARIEGKNIDPSRQVEVTKMISKVYSGYIHGASPHIMELYGGSPPHFHTRGMLNTPRMRESTRDLWNYMYRSFLSHICVAKLFGSQEHLDFLVKKKERFEIEMAKTFA